MPPRPVRDERGPRVCAAPAVAMPEFPPVADQLAVLRRGVEKIVPEKELAERLDWSRQTGTPLRIKYGIDPTAAHVHLGHTVPLRKMRQFQELGHQAVIIIGNATALVGDPSGRDEARAKRLTHEQVEEAAAHYLDQVGKVVDMASAEVHRNGDWFGQIDLAGMLRLCGQVTVAQLLTRDDFAKRYREERPIFLHECLYPVMQAQDSVEVRADVELGGTEQLYTFMLARDLQQNAGQKPQISVMSPILIGTDGARRMGKSLGNYIGISEEPYEQMKKFMQLPDAVMRDYFVLLTDLDEAAIDATLAGHPKEAKVRLASEVIGFYHDEDAAAKAATRWQREIGGGGLPADIPEIGIDAALVSDGRIGPLDLYGPKGLGFCQSNGEARRLIAQGGAKRGEDKQPIGDPQSPIAIADGDLFWAGKKKFARVTIGVS